MSQITTSVATQTGLCLFAASVHWSFPDVFTDSSQKINLQ